MPLCLLGLDPEAPQTIGLENSALLTAPGCLVQSNSNSPFRHDVEDECRHEGRHDLLGRRLVLTVGANYSPAPTTDCPVLPDPLSSRVAPPIGACNHTNMIINGGYEALQPGVYCGGLKLTNGADGVLSPGIFIIKDGPLIVDAGGSISGTEGGSI